ncbi:hypothetical protein RF11_08205 [Thelohanellus kitauei]|uniref:Uncharacterized protein n=1 Tax=Thelohanellus kitauei TaxID=669202 RepID=A0A0C2J7P7_THEKT|nr:hypothetical protein RF11_08205 [Thelohanellus kitauei]
MHIHIALILVFCIPRVSNANVDCSLYSPYEIISVLKVYFFHEIPYCESEIEYHKMDDVVNEIKERCEKTQAVTEKTCVYKQDFKTLLGKLFDNRVLHSTLKEDLIDKVTNQAVDRGTGNPVPGFRLGGLNYIAKQLNSLFTDGNQFFLYMIPYKCLMDQLKEDHRLYLEASGNTEDVHYVKGLITEAKKVVSKTSAAIEDDVITAITTKGTMGEWIQNPFLRLSVRRWIEPQTEQPAPSDDEGGSCNAGFDVYPTIPISEINDEDPSTLFGEPEKMEDYPIKNISKTEIALFTVLLVALLAIVIFIVLIAWKPHLFKFEFVFTKKTETRE